MNIKEKVQKNTNSRNKITIKKLKKQVKGITLIALVVTVIVLLILAGVAINLTVGDNGLFKRAQNAADTWQMAEQNEQKEIEQAGNFLDDYTSEYNKGTTVAYAKQLNKPFENDTTITDDLGNEVRIAAGFKIAQDSATVVEDGIVIEDKDGNQFVWIPVSVLNEETGEKNPIQTNTGDITINYMRTTYSTDVATGEMDEKTESEKIKNSSSSSNYYTEAIPTDEIESINANGGYYIGRYEAGDGSSTDFRSGATDGIIVIKKDQIPYNLITREDVETKSKEMKAVQGYETATTKLVSSYAWDTAIDFIQKANSDNEHSDYATSSPEGNYSDTDYGNGLIRTGQTKAISNIYDMGGSLCEYTTEKFSSENYPYVIRGGSYFDSYNVYPAGYRSNFDGTANINFGFRVTLYLQY